MAKNKIIEFSKLSLKEKISLLKSQNYLSQNQIDKLENTKINCDKYFKISENVVSLYNLPYSLLPNLLVDGKSYLVPMVTEESSVVAGAAKAVSFWYDRGGFHTKVISTKKLGHVYFIWKKNDKTLKELFYQISKILYKNLSILNEKMIKRGGGVKAIELLNKEKIKPGLFQIEVVFETCDSMGANFINSSMEKISNDFMSFFRNNHMDEDIEILMSIVSNYSPDCLVTSKVECSIKEMNYIKNISSNRFVDRFQLATLIAKKDIKRSVTHNKGIFNGIDSVALATGNDFRAIEACGHSYASRNGQYSSLTDLTIKGGIFKYEIKIPLLLGVKGGITEFHPQAKLSLDILGNPNVKELMSIVASVGLANNFAAIGALISEGIQKGHMKLHNKKTIGTS